MADYPCQEPGWVYVPPPCRAPDKHDHGACGCSYVARLTMLENDGEVVEVGSDRNEQYDGSENEYEPVHPPPYHRGEFA